MYRNQKCAYQNFCNEPTEDKIDQIHLVEFLLNQSPGNPCIFPDQLRNADRKFENPNYTPLPV